MSDRSERKPARKPREWRVWVIADHVTPMLRKAGSYTVVSEKMLLGGEPVRARLVLDPQRAPKARRK